jgi:hypothetical protein
MSKWPMRGHFRYLRFMTFSMTPRTPQCEAIFDIYASRPFQWHQKHLNARCFGPCCRTLNIQESRRTPNPHFFQVLGFTPTLGQSRVATFMGLNHKPHKSQLRKKKQRQVQWYECHWQGKGKYKKEKPM